MTVAPKPSWNRLMPRLPADRKLPSVLTSEVRLPSLLHREIKVSLTHPGPAPAAAPLIPPVVLLDLRDVPDARARHQQVLELGDALRSGIRLLVISADPHLADVHIHPDTLDLQVQYAGVLLPDPAWRDMQMQALLLPGVMGLKLAVLHGVYTLNEDNAAPVLQASRAALIPGVRCLEITELERVMQNL